MGPKHRDLITRCRTAQDGFGRLVKETDEVAVEVRTCDNDQTMRTDGVVQESGYGPQKKVLRTRELPAPKYTESPE
jgi:hypothetical protein